MSTTLHTIRAKLCLDGMCIAALPVLDAAVALCAALTVGCVSLLLIGAFG